MFVRIKGVSHGVQRHPYHMTPTPESQDARQGHEERKRGKSLTLVLQADPSLSVRNPSHVLVDLAFQVDGDEQPFASIRNHLEVKRQSPTIRCV